MHVNKYPISQCEAPIEFHRIFIYPQEISVTLEAQRRTKENGVDSKPSYTYPSIPLLFCESFEDPRRIRNTRQPVYWIKRAIRTKRCCIGCPKLRKGKHHGSYRWQNVRMNDSIDRNYALEKLDLSQLLQLHQFSSFEKIDV